MSDCQLRLYAVTFFSLAWWAMIAHNDTARKQQTQYGDNDKYFFHKRFPWSFIKVFLMVILNHRHKYILGMWPVNPRQIHLEGEENANISCYSGKTPIGKKGRSHHDGDKG